MLRAFSVLQLFAGLLYNVNGDVVIHHCSFTTLTQVNGAGPNWYYEFEENDCTNGKPSGNCVAGFKRTRAQCDARYAVLPGEVQSAGGPGGSLDINGPAAILFMSSMASFSCQDVFDGGLTTNVFYEVDYFCIDSDNTWRTICEQVARPGDEVNVTQDNLRTVRPLFVEQDCDNGLPVPAAPVSDSSSSSSSSSDEELDGSGGCVQFRHDALFPGGDFGQITFDADDTNFFPGMEYYVFRDAETPITRTEVAYVCNVAGLGDYEAAASGTGSESSSDSSDSSDEDGEYRSYTCSVPDGDAGDVLGDFSNGNEINNAVEYVFYEFENDDCVDNQGKNNIPPSIENSNVDCVVSIRSERDCGTQPFGDLQTREAFNNGEIDDQTGRKGPAILYSRPLNKGCENKETIIQVDYLCKE